MRSASSISGFYSFSFTAASLRPEIARVVAEKYLEHGSWDTAKGEILRTNAIQCRSAGSLKRIEREFRQRLQCLTHEQLRLLSDGTKDERLAISWIAAVKHSAFIWEFVENVLREKLAHFDPILRPSDYESFVASQILAHPDLEGFSKTTQTKIRTVLFLMLQEAGLVQEQNKEYRIQRPSVPAGVLGCVMTDEPQLMAAFLWTDEEISKASVK